MGASGRPLPMLTKPCTGRAVAGEPRLRDADRPAHRGGQATVELPRVRPSLPHLCMSPLGLSTQKMSAEWVFVGCRSEALGFGRQWRFLQGLVHRRRLDQEAQGTALTLSSSKLAGRASRTGTGPREGGWRKRCLCWLQRLWGWRPCLFSQRAPGMQGGGGGCPQN